MRWIFLVFSFRLCYNQLRIGGGTIPTEKDYKVIEKATIYDLRRIFVNSGKESYTLDELCKLLDTIADAKDQE